MEKLQISTRSSKKGYLYVKKEDLSAPAPISVNKTGIKRISNCIDSTDTDYEKTPPHNSHLGSYEHKGKMVSDSDTKGLLGRKCQILTLSQRKSSPWTTSIRF